MLLPAGHGGEGSEHFITSRSSSRGRFFFELNHAGGFCAPVIFSRNGGTSLTSDEEALRTHCWSSMPLRGQVVRPRQLSGSQRMQFIAGRGPSSAPPLLLGDFASRTPTSGSRDSQGLDCFPSLVLGCFLQFERPYLQMVGFLGRVDVRGFLQFVTATCSE
jgi:hypothetical protein